MIRDMTMIFSVLVSVFSLGFGLYKNIEAGNAKGFAYQQAYKIIGLVQKADISNTAKAQILDTALDALSTPPPVVDLSRSSADTGTSVCPATRQNACGKLAADLALANTECARSKGVSEACIQATQLKNDVIAQSCFTCYR